MRCVWYLAGCCRALYSTAETCLCSWEGVRRKGDYSSEGMRCFPIPQHIAWARAPWLLIHIIFHLRSLQDHCERWTRIQIAFVELEKEKSNQKHKEEVKISCILHLEHHDGRRGWVAVLLLAVSFPWGHQESEAEWESPNLCFAELLWNIM